MKTRTKSRSKASFASLDEIANATTDNFVELIRLSRIDPRRYLRFADWSGIDFSGCDLRGYDFTGARLTGCKFDGALIAGAEFKRAELNEADLRAAKDWTSHSEGPARGRNFHNNKAIDSFEQSRRQLEIQARQLRELAESYNEEKIRTEAANQAKSEFLANVSYKLRTPLNAIIGFSEMMRDGVHGPINPKYERYVKDIYASGRYLLEMINDILDMSKIEAGRMTLSPEWVALRTIIEECLTVVHPSSIEGKVDLIQCGNANISVFADKRALKQVLINLLSNAIKFTPPGGKVVLRASRYRGSLRIAIADTGVGIAKHDLSRLGKPLEQVGNQLTKGHKGTGLGLAISRSLVEMHGGKLDIKSRIGEGTTVTCILPEGNKSSEES